MNIITSLQPLPEILPIIQKTIELNDSPERLLIRLIAAEKIDETTIPARIRFCGNIPSLPNERTNTSIKVKSAPPIAEKGSIHTENPKKIDIIAPKAAPEDIPIVKGPAKGLANSPWKTTPDTASAAPSKKERIMRGILI